MGPHRAASARPQRRDLAQLDHRRTSQALPDPLRPLTKALTSPQIHINDLGLLDEFLRLPHQKAFQIRARSGDAEVVFGDFSHLPTRCKYVALLPQWDFLNFLARKAGAYPWFSLRMRAEVTGLIEENGRVAGVRARTPDGELEVRADLVVGADGRHSDVRARAGLPLQELGAPIDVLWFRVSRRPDDPETPTGNFTRGRLLAMINRTDYWQCGYVIRKGALEQLKARGLAEFRADLARLSPILADRVGEVRGWDDVNLLTVRVDRLTRWYRPGLLCIGDAAHAMSPVGGVGINLAIQDAVAAANILAVPLRDGTLTLDHLRRVQKRRELPTRLTQRLQVLIQDRVLTRVLSGEISSGVPAPIRLFGRFPFLARVPARVVGVGFRPEHVKSPAVPIPA
ncbi:FAD-dependent oxidoreductase [Carbonactinospora thermoautotrophica]|uniref:FAD-dependent oxidoreductase n=1 Tax=Carbonactinospora thermoautotrophica TaxID=1469144 RepID=UPI000BB46C80|nr:FAD-dependent oxidoreductase [Carbonactinospora thermoautotrophica]